MNNIPTTSAKNLPESIRLTTLDLSFLIPETEDMESVYFPMSVVCCLPLKRPVKVEEFVTALAQLDQRFPQFRLGYKLDYIHNRWVRIPEDQRASYWANCIQMRSTDLDVAGKIAEAVSTNITPLDQPIMFYLDDQHIVVKMHHSLGDGRYFGRMMGYMLLALADPAAFEKLPTLPMNFGMPVWKLIFQTPQQGMRVLTGAIKSFVSYYKEFRQDVTVQETTRELAPIVTGSPMGIECKLVEPEVLKQLNEMKIALSSDTKITLNTLLQVLIATRLTELGLTGPTPVYTIPVDLRRYLKSPGDFYPGNLISQIKVKSSASDDLLAECTWVQRNADEQLENYEPLLAGPGESIFALNTRAYKRVNRQWLLATIKTDKRFFLLSNLGHLDSVLRPLSSLIDLPQGVFAAAPLMGGIPLVFCFSMAAGHGYITMTYDPRVLSKEQAMTVAEMFDTEWLTAKFPAKDAPVAATLVPHEA